MAIFWKIILHKSLEAAEYKMPYLCLVFSIFLSPNMIAAESTCFGSTGNGRLENGVKLPGNGKNFISYGIIPVQAGRTYVHSKVKKVVVDSYNLLLKEQPNKVFKYAETGFKKGGKFKPHKTHQNGLSIDFMVPVLNKQGKSVHLPTNPLNRYGYNIEFDKQSRYKEYQLDYEALGAHVVTLHKMARKNGIELWRVIFDPALQPNLYKTRYGEYIKNNIKIPKKKSWVRHDEHYHVDFLVKCKKL